MFGQVVKVAACVHDEVGGFGNGSVGALLADGEPFEDMVDDVLVWRRLAPFSDEMDDLVGYGGTSSKVWCNGGETDVPLGEPVGGVAGPLELWVVVHHGGDVVFGEFHILDVLGIGHVADFFDDFP